MPETYKQREKRWVKEIQWEKEHPGELDKTPHIRRNKNNQIVESVEPTGIPCELDEQ